MSRDFRLFWAGQVTSAFGSAFTAVAVPSIAVRALGAGPAETGLLAAVNSLPLLLFGLGIGVWADRLPRRRPYLVGSDLLAAAGLGAITLALITGRLTVSAFAGLTFLLGTVNLLLETVYFVHLRGLIGRDDLLRARGRLYGGEYAGRVLGRALAGPAATAAALVPFLIDLVTYLASAICLLLIRTPEPRRQPVGAGQISRTELAAGFVLLRAEPFLRRLIPFIAIQQVVAGTVLALVAPFLLNVLGIPASWYGLLFVPAGVAGATSTLVTDRQRSRDPRQLTVLGYIGMPITTVLLALSAGPLPIAATTAALGIGLPHFFGGIANAGLTGFVTAALSESTLGRITVALKLVSSAALVGGSVLGGLLAEQVTIRSTLWIAAGLSLLSLTTLRAVARVGGFPEARTTSVATR